MSRAWRMAGLAFVMALAGSVEPQAGAQETGPVSREEVDKLKEMLKRMEENSKRQEAVIQQLKTTVETQAKELGKESGTKETRAAEIEKVIEELRKREKLAAPKEEEEKWYDRIELGFGATATYQGSNGAQRRFWDHNAGNWYWAPDRDVSDATISFDFEILSQVAEHGTAFSLIEGGNGDGLDANTPTLSGFNDDALNENRIHISELWYEHKWFDDKVRLRVGKLDLTTEFDNNAVANDETTQFLSSAFVNNIAVEWPDYTPGIMAWYSPWEWLSLGYSVADADSDWDNVWDNTFQIWEIDFKPKIFNRQGNYRGYGWMNDSLHQDIKYPGRWKQKGYGVGVSMDQELTDHLTIFGRYGWQRECVYQFEDAWSFGFQINGGLWKRPKDTFGFAYGIISMGGDWKEYHEDPVVDSFYKDFPLGIRPGDERHIEFYYSLQVHEHLAISPSVQWVDNAMGDRNSNQVWVGGVRAQLSF